MTTVVAVETEEGVLFAADSRISGWHVNDGWVDKVIRNGEITFAAAGYLRTIQILAYGKFVVPPVTDGAAAIDRYVSLELIPAIVKAFTDSGEKEALEYSQLLVALRGRVYSVGGDGSWLRNKNGFYAVGSGANYALGALEAGATPKKAVKIAAQYDAGTNKDVREVSLKNVPEVP